MPRKSRIDAPGAFHHIIARGIDRRAIFSDDSDRNGFLERLGDVLINTKTACYAWALIPNHFHLSEIGWPVRFMAQCGAIPRSWSMSCKCGVRGASGLRCRSLRNGG